MYRILVYLYKLKVTLPRPFQSRDYELRQILLQKLKFHTTLYRPAEMFFHISIDDIIMLCC